ncbi:hypothetical protein MXMO3_01688 [Maritalea myrionectae]|uniref:Uncharacterized protein n=1 Tax=Maritalea myrionectae TaxID=454601 RepID=A0A2R4ME66_9HYPH|nr:hypothetical protein [Maritalea myrionectae]AVX04214.1 hypothetical protein MXMO3_01688 [Maritalea myrionectae]
MTDQSKYQIAIEAIRTKRHYQTELAEAMGDDKWLNMPSCGDLSAIHRVMKRMFSEYLSFDVGHNIHGVCFASIRTSPKIEKNWYSDEDSFEPSPAKSLLIVMLMALEEMEKRND